MSTRRTVLTVTALLGTALIALGLVWFQPWKLITDTRVTDVLPAVAVRPAALPGVAPARPAASPTTAPTAAAADGAGAAPAPRPHTDVLLAAGPLVSHEHDTSGTVSLIRRADGSRVLAIAGLRTSDGPDVKVWLTDQPVVAGEAGWYVFDDGAHLSLGALEGNLGDQVYDIPPHADLGRFTSVSLWCDRFDVSFGAATLRRPT